MAATNINRVVLTGNLTRNPELRQTQHAGKVCNLRVAVNTRRKNASGEWVDKPNYFDVTIWGPQGESAAQYLEKGRPVAIDGRLEWREWVDKDNNKRQSVEIVADSVQFLGGNGNSNGNGNGTSSDGESPEQLDGVAPEQLDDDAPEYSDGEAPEQLDGDLPQGLGALGGLLTGTPAGSGDEDEQAAAATQARIPLGDATPAAEQHL